MRALIASAALLVLAVVFYGDAARSMFAPQVVSEPTMAYGYVSEAQRYGGVSAPLAQQLSNAHYAQPVAYVEPPVQVVAISQAGWGWSDLALLAVASGVVGAAIGQQSKGNQEKKRAAAFVDEEAMIEEAMIEEAMVAALAVGGSETPADLEVLAKGLNPAVGFWDPLNLADGEFWDQSNESTIGFLRHAEIKHGRVAMAGFVGYCVHANGIHFPWKVPGDELCAPGVSPPELWQNIPVEAKWQILLTIGLFEFYSEAAMAKSPGQGGHYMRGGKPGLFPAFNLPKGVKGQSGIGTLEDADGLPLLPHPVPLNLYDPFGFNKNKSDEWKAQKLKVEINNGRLAMIGLMSLLSEGAVPGSVPALKGLIPASGEINVMSPFDFTKPFFG
jgi:hypothetical protein